MARSTATGTPRLPELDWDPQRHIKEKPREQQSQPIITEYEEFHLSLRKEARHR